jgi:hypothetical protein
MTGMCCRKKRSVGTCSGCLTAEGRNRGVREKARWAPVTRRICDG